VEACQNRDHLPVLEQMLEMANQQGWTNLVTAIRAILGGQRDNRVLEGLDAEDMVIVRSILEGLQNPATLPDPSQGASPAMAAPGLAQMIHAAARDLRRLGGRLKALVDGERNIDVLCKGMSENGRQLMLDLLSELGRLSEQ